jgi:hypothetical protein
VVRDKRIARPLRWGAALGALPVPGPIDEAVLLLVGGMLWLFYRDELREAWQQAAAPSSREPPSDSLLLGSSVRR